MRKRFAILLLLAVMVVTFFSGCSMGEDSLTRYDDKMEAVTGKWQLLDEEDTYFLFDGAESVMTFQYYENAALKYEGKFRSIYRADPDGKMPLFFGLKRNDKEKEDWLNCYVENFETEFTQFSIASEEEDLGVNGGTVYTHIYRISELPYKMGTYVLEGKEYKTYATNGFNDGTYRIPEGRYVAESGQSLTVLPIMFKSYMLFQYQNGETVIEGVFNVAQDKKTIYLYIEHDIYEKVRDTDKENYDTTFSLNYPPDFYLRGDFDTNDNTLVVNGLYHHPDSPTKLDDSVWAFAQYVKQ